MTRYARIAAGLTLTAVLFGVGGCVNLLPKAKPVQLYRFGYDAALVEKSVAPAPGLPIAMTLGTIVFPPGSAGDGIVTVEDNEVAYVAEARWAAAAQALFNASVSEGFARGGGNIRLEPRGPSSAAYRLDIVVRRFETVYGHGKPTVSLAMDARITRLSDRTVVGQRFVTADVGVKRNDMSMTVDAYSKATSQAVAALIGFSQETLSPLTPPVTPMSETPKDGKQKVEGL